MSQPQFAAKLGVHGRTVRHWEAGRPIRVDWQAALDTLLSWQTPAVAAAFRGQLRLTSQLSPQEEPVDRRQLFKVGAVVGGLAAIGLEDQERVRWLATGTGQADLTDVENVRTALYAAQQLDDKLGSPAAQGLVISAQQLTDAMLSDCSAELRPHVLALNAELTGFAGCLAWDEGDYGTSARLYNDAREDAHEAEDADLGAYMLCHLSQLAIWQERPRVSLDHAVAARSWVAQTDDQRLRAYVAMRAAEAAAGAKQQQACLAALDEADCAIEGLQPCHPSESRAYFVSAGMIESYRGNCLYLLGDPAAAADASRRSLVLMDPLYTRDRAISLLELERSLVQLDEIEEAASVVGDAADLTRKNRSPRLSKAIQDGHKALSPWSTTRAVQQLDRRLCARDIVVV
ncbi:helix-turn-helix domain-containing protein [Nocardia sp. CA-128927]|uniref:helix-turn-helix domain-containing protein n=1 Tax=Nocardia sp. CA-128927 TaxID=3239975 RepID=UPI003D98196B